MEEPVPFTIFMWVRTLPAWLSLPPSERFAFVDSVVRPLLGRHPEVRLRYFDAEAFHGRITDVLLWETHSLARYQSLVEGLRETAFWDRYFQVLEIVPSVENGFAAHYGVPPLAPA